MTQSDKSPQAPVTRFLPVSVQLLSTLLFGAFGIVAVIFAFNASWIAGVAVAVLLGWRGGFAPGPWQGYAAPSNEMLMSLTPEAQQRSSGNASFDAYRRDTITRLEQEQEKFENFLGRLRDAKDKAEFDDFLDQRAARIEAAN